VTVPRAGLKPIGPIVPNLGPVLELSTLGYSRTDNNTLQVLQRTTLDPASLRADPDSTYHLLFTFWQSNKPISPKSHPSDTIHPPT